MKDVFLNVNSKMNVPFAGEESAFYEGSERTWRYVGILNRRAEKHQDPSSFPAVLAHSNHLLSLVLLEGPCRQPGVGACPRLCSQLSTADRLCAGQVLSPLCKRAQRPPPPQHLGWFTQANPELLSVSLWTALCAAAPGAQAATGSCGAADGSPGTAGGSDRSRSSGDSWLPTRPPREKSPTSHPVLPAG